jgi:Co/Zn/Cd efflux system component
MSDQRRADIEHSNNREDALEHRRDLNADLRVSDPPGKFMGLDGRRVASIAMTEASLLYEHLGGDFHRHERNLIHAHPHSGPHTHGADQRHRARPRHGPDEHRDDGGAHGHSHGLVEPSIVRSRAGLRAVAASLAILGATAAIQAAVYIATGSIALLADLIHNFGDALTAVPLGTAFLLRSQRAERYAGLGVVLAIFASACVAGFLAVEKIINPHPPDHLLALAIAGAIGFAGNEVAAQVRLRAGRRLESPALVADGYHARTDGFVSLGVMLSAALVALGLPIADPVIAIVITGVILQITRQSWRTVRGHEHPHES